MSLSIVPDRIGFSLVCLYMWAETEPVPEGWSYLIFYAFIQTVVKVQTKYSTIIMIQLKKKNKMKI
jgi:hypothetical protein